MTYNDATLKRAIDAEADAERWRIDYGVASRRADERLEQLNEALAQINAANARIRQLEEALRPLAAHAPYLLDMIEDERPVPWLTQTTYGDVRRAAAVLAATPDPVD